MNDTVEPLDENNPFRNAKVGDRLWIRNKNEPSEFEVLLSDVLESCPSQDKTDTVFYVSAYSFHGSSLQVKYILNSLPKTELPYNGHLSFVTIEKPMIISIPNPKISVSIKSRNRIYHLVVNAQKFDIQEQILLICACKQS